MRSYNSPDSAVKYLQPEQPVIVYRPHALKRATEFFLSRFRGKVLYAVKTNPDEHVLKDLWAAGVRQYDVASLHEVALVRNLFADADLYFMHPVKSRKAIREAYFTYGVRHFSLDTADELQKIIDETTCPEGVKASDLALHVRLAIPNSHAELALTDKFGASLEAAPALLRAVRDVAKHTGVCFHVGSQCMHPDAYKLAIRLAKQVIKQADVRIDSFDVGGGFPSVYPGMTPPPMITFFRAIHEATRDLVKQHGCELLCEPGRALVAESGSVVVRVEARKGDYLYINDGTYGALFDAGTPKFQFPCRLVSRKDTTDDLVGYSFFGPTCDSLDTMKGPFYLPADIKEGDYIEVGQLGAYGRTMATRFNGFSIASRVVAVKDEPMLSAYLPQQPALAEDAQIAYRATA